METFFRHSRLRTPDKDTYLLTPSLAYMANIDMTMGHRLLHFLGYAYFYEKAFLQPGLIIKE